MNICYQSDVQKIPDEELLQLSNEIEESYNICGDEYCRLPEDDEATQRYHELRAEIRRRWEILNPEEAARQAERMKFFRETFGSLVLGRLAAGAEAMKLMKAEAEYDSLFMSGGQWGGKIGQIITAHRPTRFLEPQQ